MAKQNIAAYEKEPLEKRFPIRTTYELIRRSTESFTGNPALAQLYTAQKDEKEICLNFKQLNHKLTQTANLLGRIGVTRKDAVTILLPGIMESQIALWGIQAVGIANPVNHFLDADSIVEIMNEVRSKVLITLAAGDTIGLGIRIPDIAARVPSLTHILLANDSPERSVVPEAFDIYDGSLSAVRVLDFNRAMEEMPGEALSFDERPTPSDTAIYFHTGGTTGQPKIAMLAHSSVTFVAQVYADYNAHHGKAHVLNPLPLFHVFGTIAASLAVFIQGRCVVMMTPTGFRNPNVVKNWWHFIERFKVAWFATVPTILGALLEVPIEDNNIDCLKYINSGSAPLAVKLRKACSEKFNAEVVSGYGMTESSCLITRCLGNYETPDDTVGVKVPYTEVIAAKVKNQAIEKICHPGEPGVVLVKGPNIFKGYLNPEENKKAWVEGGWFNTGDIGILDEDGYLRLTGRAKDLIIRGGHNIDPLIIESPLEKHPAVSQAIAVGQPDAYAGEIPVAYVCLKPDKSASEEELLEYCREHISERAAVPKRIEIIEGMPLTAVGKISKPALRDMATERAVRQAFKAAGIKAELAAFNDPKKGQMIRIKLSAGEDIKKAADLLSGLPVEVEFYPENEPEK